MNIKKIKKLFIILIPYVIVIFLASFAYGLPERYGIFLHDYSVSEDGMTIIVKTGNSNSMGYIRAMKTTYENENIFCSFYKTFGGLNSKIGARDEFEIQLTGNEENIYFSYDKENYILVLQKNENGEWSIPEEKSYIQK